MCRAGVRCGIPDFMIAGQAMFAKLWSGQLHPLYCKLEIADSLTLPRMPDEVKQFTQ